MEGAQEIVGRFRDAGVVWILLGKSEKLVYRRIHVSLVKGALDELESSFLAHFSAWIALLKGIKGRSRFAPLPKTGLRVANAHEGFRHPGTAPVGLNEIFPFANGFLIKLLP